MTSKKPTRHKMRDGIVNRSTTSVPSYAFLVRVDGKALAQLLAGAPKVRRQRPTLRVVR